MVVDDAVRVDVAGAAVARELGAIPRRPVPGHVETLQALGVHVQQRARLGPLIAPKGPLPRRPAPSRDAVAGQHLPHRRAPKADQARQPGRSVVGPLARIQNALLDGVLELPRTRPRPRRPRPQDTPATPARPHSQPASGATTCAPWPLKRNSAPPPRAEKHPPRSNGSTANGHPRRACIYRLPRPVLLRSGSVVADRTLHRGPDVPSQPFTKSVGSSARPLLLRPARSTRCASGRICDVPMLPLPQSRSLALHFAGREGIGV